MRTRIVGPRLLAGMLVVAGCAGRREPEQEVRLAAQRFELPGDTVHLFDLAGEVRIERGEGSSTVVEIVRIGTDAERLTIDTGRVGGEQTLRVRFPGERVSTSLRERGSVRVAVADDGRFGNGVSGRTVEIGRGGEGVRAHANIVARVPAGRTLLLDLGAGKATVAKVDASVRIATPHAEVTADSSRGSLTLDVAEGTVKVSSFTGPVTIRSRRAVITVSQVEGNLLDVRTDTGSVNANGIDASRLDVRGVSAPLLLTSIRSAVASVTTTRGRAALSLDGSADSVRMESDSADVSLSLIGALRSQASLRSRSGNIAIRVSPAVSATVLLEGELRAPSVELTLASLERTRDVPCTMPPRDGASAGSSCNVVRGTLGTGEGRILARSQSGDVRLAGF